MRSIEKYPDSIEINGRIYVSENVYQDELIAQSSDRLLKSVLWFAASLSIVFLIGLTPLIIKGYTFNQNQNQEVQINGHK